MGVWHNHCWSKSGLTQNMTKLSPTGPYPNLWTDKDAGKKKQSSVKATPPSQPGNHRPSNSRRPLAWHKHHASLMPSVGILAPFRHAMTFCASSTAATVHWVSAPRKVEAWRLATKGAASSVIGSSERVNLWTLAAFKGDPCWKLRRGLESRFTPLQVGPAFF